MPRPAVRPLLIGIVSLALTAGAVVALPSPASALALPAPPNAIVECDATGTWSTDPVLGPVLLPDGTVTTGPVEDPVCDALRRLEDTALTQVIQLRGLAGSRDLARVAARDDVTALLWTGVDQAVRTAPAERTPDQAAIVGWLEKVWVRHQVKSASGARSLYRSFARTLSDGRPGACVFTPPAPYEGEYPGDAPRWSGCFQTRGSLGNFFTGDGPRTPSYEDFVRWGAVPANDELATGYPQAVKLSAAQIGIISGVGAGVVAGTGLLALAKTNPKAYGKIDKLGAAAKALDNLAVPVEGGTTPGTTIKPGSAKYFAKIKTIFRAVTSFLRVMPIIDIIVTAVDALVTRVLELFVFNNPTADLEQRLDRLVADAQKAPDLTAMLDDGPQYTALVQLFASSLTTTSGDPAPPSSVGDDPQFRATTAAGNPTLPSPTIQLREWSGRPQTVELRGGYFVVTDADGLVTTTTTLPALDAQGRQMSYSLVRSGTRYQWVTVPGEDLTATCVSDGRILCPTVPAAQLRLGDGTAASVEVTTDTSVGLRIDGPRSTTQGEGASYSVSATDSAGRPVAVTGVAWEARRELEPRRLDGAFAPARDVCQPAPDGTPSPVAGSQICVETASGVSFDPAYLEAGTWTVTATASGPGGLALRRVATVTVNNAEPLVIAGGPCPDTTVIVLVPCSDATVDESTDVVLRPFVADGYMESITLTASLGTRVLARATVPCSGAIAPVRQVDAPPQNGGVESVVALHLAGGDSACDAGVTATRVPDQEGRPSGSFLVTWRLRSDEPLTGRITVTADDDRGAGVARQGVSWDPAGWSNRPPVVSATTNQSIVVNAGAPITYSGTVTDLRSTVRAVSATLDGVPVALPQLTAQQPAGAYRFAWSGTAPQVTGTGLKRLELTFADAQDARTTTSATIGVNGTPDTTPPVITLANPQEFFNAYYGLPDLPNLVATDPESGILSSSGCGRQGGGVNGPVTLTCTATSAGGTSSRSFDVRIDSTPPVVGVEGLVQDGETYSQGTMSAALPQCTATDGLSGVDGGALGCTVTGYSTAVGTHTARFTAADLAGNVTTVSYRYTVVAGTPPVYVNFLIGGQVGNAGWYRSDVRWRWLSVIRQPGYTVTRLTGCDLAFTTISTDGTTTPSCVVEYTGPAGPGTFSKTFTIRRDATPPTVNIQGLRTAFVNGCATEPCFPTPAFDDTTFTSCSLRDLTSGLEGGLGGVNAPVTQACSGVTGRSTAVGSHTMRATFKDVAGNEGVGTVSYSISEGTPPVITPRTSRPGIDGWYAGPVTLVFDATDADSRVTSRTAGCAGGSVNSETTATGVTFTCSATSAGGTGTGTATVRVDTTPPVLTVTGGPADGGIYASSEVPAAPTCSATDAGSGVGAACTVAGWSATIGAQTVTVRVADRVGNLREEVRRYTVVGAVDTTPPVITVGWESPTTPVDGVFGSPVDVFFQVAEDGSTVTARSGCERVSRDTTTPGAGITLTCSATSRGGTATKTFVLRVDREAPAITLVGGPVDGAEYAAGSWPDEPVCSVDDGTGVGVAATGACTVTGFSRDPGQQVLVATAKDRLGNTATRRVAYTVLPDTTPPVVTPSVTGPAGAAGWFTGDVAVRFDLVDPETPVHLQFDCAPLTVTQDTAAGSVECAAASQGGTTTATATWKRDATPPVVTVVGGPADGASYGLGQVPPVGTCTATDATSGVVGECLDTGYAVTAGSHALTYSATDAAGNVGRVTRTYTVAASVPTAPRRVTATPGDRSASVTWLAPLSDGGSAVTQYRVTATRPGRAKVTVLVDAPATTATVTGLTAGEEWTVGVAAINAAGASAAGRTVVTPVGSPVIAPRAAPNGTAGVAYTFTVGVNAAPAATLSVSDGALPPGLTLSPAGVLAGTPTRAGTFAFTVRAANGVGEPATRAYTVTVRNGPASALVPSAGSGQVAAPGAVLGAPLAATVTDAWGNPVAGRTVTFTAGGGARFAGSTTATAVSGPDGVATSPALTAGSVAGPFTVTATSAAPVRATRFLLSVVPASARSADLVVSVDVAATAAAGAVLPATVTVRNAGPDAAAVTGMTLTAAAGLGIQSAAGPGLSATTRGALTAQGVTLAAGATATWAVSLVAGPAGGAGGLTAVALSRVPDPDGASSTATASVRIG